MPMNAVYKRPEDLPGVIAVFPLPGALLLPRGQMPLNIFEPRYLAMIDDSLRSGTRLIGMIQPDPAHRGPHQTKPLLFSVGCIGRITQLAESGDGRYLIQLTGISRYRVEEELAMGTPYRQCRAQASPDATPRISRKQRFRHLFCDAFQVGGSHDGDAIADLRVVRRRDRRHPFE